MSSEQNKNDSLYLDTLYAVAEGQEILGRSGQEVVCVFRVPDLSVRFIKTLFRQFVFPIIQ